MQRDTAPSDALHIGHRCPAVDIGDVPPALRNDRENSHRRRMVRHPGGDRRAPDEGTIGVDRDLLLGDRHYDVERPLRDRLLVLGCPHMSALGQPRTLTSFDHFIGAAK